MGFYLRKSFSAGPVRLNLSGSGVGVSFGMKGARVGIGARGNTYTHVGRHGLYYRSSSSGRAGAVRQRKTSTEVRTSVVDSSISSVGSSSAFFDDKQISSKRVHVDFALSGPHCVWQWVLGIAGVIVLLSGSTERGSQPDPSSEGWRLAIGLGLLGWVVFRYIRHVYLSDKASRLHDQLMRVLNHQRDETCAPEQLGELTVKMQAGKLQGQYLDYAKYRCYTDYLERILSDVRISPAEAATLKTLEDVLNLDEASLLKFKRWVFNRAYLEVVEDRFLSRDEDGGIRHAKEVLGLSDDDVADELGTLEVLRSVRTIGEEGLKPIEVDVTLGKGEVCYHKTRGRIVKDKTLKSYQSGGQRHTIRGTVVEKEGDLYLTSTRIIIVGEGVTSIKLEKIFDVETDLDDNSISLDVDNRKSQLVLSVPDSHIFSTKLNKLVNR